MTGAPAYDRAKLVPLICKRLSKGEPLAVICRDIGVGRRTVYQWRDEDAAIAEQMLDAREDGADALAQECIEIADDGSRDYMTLADGREVPDHDHIQRSKLRVDTRLKLLAKWFPKEYGDKQAIEHSGPNGGPIQSISTTDPVEAARIYQQVMSGDK